MVPSSHKASIAFCAFSAKYFASMSRNSSSSVSDWMVFKALINSSCAISLYDMFPPLFMCLQNTKKLDSSQPLPITDFVASIYAWKNNRLAQNHGNHWKRKACWRKASTNFHSFASSAWKKYLMQNHGERGYSTTIFRVVPFNFTKYMPCGSSMVVLPLISCVKTVCPRVFVTVIVPVPSTVNALLAGFG